MRVLSAISMALLLTACGGNGPEANDTTGTPETETTGTAQSVQQTSSATATTTGASGGHISNMSTEDKEFVVNAGMAGLAEVQMGNLAVQKAQSADVKAFAQRMVTDHSKSNQELQQLATAKGLALAAELSGEMQQGLEHLATLSGTEFDKAYMQHMVADHGKAVTLFQNGSTNAQDADLKAWATKTLPVLQEHATLAQQVAGKV
jgi:putative membrane protein